MPLGVIAGPISGLIMDRMQGIGGLHGRWWPFTIEGLPAIGLGIAAHLDPPDRPRSAVWLTRVERDPQVYVSAFIHFAFFCSLNTVLLRGPTVLERAGVATTLKIGWLTGIISVVSAVGMALVGYNTDRTTERRWHVAPCGSVAAASFVAPPLAAGSVAGTVAPPTVASVGIFSILSPVSTIPSAHLEGSAAGGIALNSAIGSFGGAVCPTFIGWLTVATGALYGALAVVGALHAVGMVVLVRATSPANARAP